MTPAQLDAQCPVKIDRWVDVHSDECKVIDDDLHWFTLKCMKIGFEDGWMFTDSLGRLWGKGKDNKLFPYHTEYGKELVGYRISARAAN